MKMTATLSFLGALLASLQTVSAAPGDLTPEAARDSQVNVLVVRHADKACSPVECDLTDKGYAQRDKFRGQIAGLVSEGYQVADIFASNACRTVLTVSPIADDAGRALKVFPAADGIETCSFLGDGDGLQRPDADERPLQGIADGNNVANSRAAVLEQILEWQPQESGRYLFVIADHSNHVCRWIEGFGVLGEEYEGEGDCVDGLLDEADFADIFWVYRSDPSADPEWHVDILEDAFETDN